MQEDVAVESSVAVDSKCYSGGDRGAKTAETPGIISELTERKLLLEEQLEKAIVPISTIRSLVPSLVVSISKILS